MADDILHHHDGVIDQDSDGKDQSKERDSIQRVPVEIEDHQRQSQSHRNGQRHNPGFSQPEC